MTRRAVREETSGRELGLPGWGGKVDFGMRFCNGAKSHAKVDPLGVPIPLLFNHPRE